MRSFLVCLAVLALLPPAPAQIKRRERPSDATRACGTEVGWRKNLPEAMVEARKSGRPVFWYVPTVDGSRMDRKPELDLYMMTGPFSSPEVVALLGRAFVPVKERAAGESQERYGLAPLDFIEPGFLVLAPDGKEIGRIDKITTFNDEWLLWQLRRLRARLPELPMVGDALALAELFLAEGDGARALESAEAAEAADGQSAETKTRAREARYARARAYVFLRRAADAEPLLKELMAGEDEVAAGARVEHARLQIRQGRFADAAAALARTIGKAGAREQEARFFLGVCQMATQRDEEARATWKALAGAEPGSCWTRKASAEFQRLGPFSRAFQRFDWLPEDAFLDAPDGTRRPRTPAEARWVARRSIDLLLMTQKADGSWDDSNYDFGGTDSLPNVYAAGTALAACALHAWRDLDPRCETAVARATRWLDDEAHLALDDKDEIVWAHAYRLLLYQRLLRAPESEATAGLRRKAIAVVKALMDSQLPNGGWRHEYPNPFATATVLHALSVIGSTGVPIGRDAVARGAKLLATTRGSDGTFSYGFARRGGSDPGFSAGRTPICELALLGANHSDQERLVAAIQASVEHHGRLERVRKMDDHADDLGNGGFFYWYALFGRMEAINAVADPKLRTALRARLRQTVLDIAEIDGGFVDSHELGKTYGTAMGLLCLEGTEDPGQ